MRGQPRSIVIRALASGADLPVCEILDAAHSVADLTLGLGQIVIDYLA
jgi:acetoacetate decarboxylase